MIFMTVVKARVETMFSEFIGGRKAVSRCTTPMGGVHAAGRKTMSAFLYMYKSIKSIIYTVMFD